MNSKFVITPRLPKLLHGADYNPEQWLKVEGVFEKDIEYMKKAGFNCVTLGVFSWSMLEPDDGVYDFSWMDKVINTLYKNGIYTILATPTGARPVWLTHKYPEVSRVEKNRVKNLHGGRHNHCYTSPVYRRKTKEINTRLAERYANNPAVIMWHISNELSGQCYCDKCQSAFREWLKKKYNNDLDALNDAWYTIFWSQKYSDWEQIEAPADNGMSVLHGLNLDWNRFCTEQTLDFYREEVKAVKSVNPDIPCTINMMAMFTELDYTKFLDDVDVISWDSYPCWHTGDDYWNAMSTAFNHDLMRSYKNQPFMMMENTPSTANWCGVSRLRHPNLLELTSMQALAHGSNTVQYFQWRQSNGSCEKWHGAVISHRGKDDTIVFKNVVKVGKDLKKLNDDLYNADISPKVAIIFDTENKWAIDDGKGPRNIGMKYNEACLCHYAPFWEAGIPCDVIDSTASFDKYDLLIAPMLYMLKDGVADRLKSFVNNGGTLVGTYFTGLVNETDLCFNGDLPGQGLSEVFGLWQEDFDALYDHQENQIAVDEQKAGFKGTFKTSVMCDLVHPTTANVLGTFAKDWYAGWPALLENKYGKGSAFYIASFADIIFLKEFYSVICKRIGIERNLDVELPKNVTVGKRGDIYFFQNFNSHEETVNLSNKMQFTNALTGEKIKDRVVIPSYGVIVAK